MLTTTPKLKIGDLLYCHPMFGGWKAAAIMSETKSHWIVGTKNIKVHKLTMLQGRKCKTKEQIPWYDKQGKDDLEFCWRWRHIVANHVMKCEDAHVLVQIAALAGTELK